VGSEVRSIYESQDKGMIGGGLLSRFKTDPINRKTVVQLMVPQPPEKRFEGSRKTLYELSAPRS